MSNFVQYHLHSSLSNLTAGTGADSVTNFEDYIYKARDLGMNAFAFSEHGSVMSHIKKKHLIEENGMKYIHANEIYLTEGITIDEETGELKKIRDNYHFLLIGKNFEGYKELNELTSKSYNRDDGHFYYNPRLTFDELKNTSDNILMTSACLASPVWRLYKKAYDQFGVVDQHAKQELEELLHFFSQNNNRMFFEIQYHNVPDQIEFNRMLVRLSKDLKIPLIAGNDCHALNQEHAKARQLYLKSKGASYGDEDSYDLSFKSYDEFVEMFEKQDAIPRNKYIEAIDNTNMMASMVEEFKLDTTPKYPKLYDNPIEVFKKGVNEGVIKRGVDKFPKEKQDAYYARIKEELDTYIKLDAIDYMLLQKHIIDWCHENDIWQGYGRGSVNGSLIAYLLGITEMDSIKYNLNFFRFLNPERISLPDIDIDFPPSRRQEVIDFISSIKGIDFAEIITFNTFALKGSIREVGRGLGMDLDEVDRIAKAVESFNGEDHIDASYKRKYPELFAYVDIFNGVVTSMGSHPSGFIVSPIDLNSNVSTVYTKDSKHKVTSVNMKELDGENYVKLDVLGLMNMELINETCKLAGIERLIPDNIDINDIAVWKSMRESTLGVFQFESNTAFSYIKQLFSDETLETLESSGNDIDFISLLSMANGAIRPSGNSYRYDLSRGILKDNGHPALNEFLKPTLGYLIFQESIMRFLTLFCYHTGAESDTVRRGLSKKSGTSQYLPKIHDGFVKYMSDNYGESQEHSEELLESFLKVIEDAQRYGFSDNHSTPYSFIGYACAWLRYYYPFEFLTVSLNLQDDDKEQTSKIVSYAKSKNINIEPIQFGKSKSAYSFVEEERSIYKGIASIKFLNIKVAEELYNLSQDKDYDRNNFLSLLVDIVNKTSVNSRQMEILIRLNFFKMFGAKEILLELYQVMVDKKKVDFVNYPMFADRTEVEHKVNKRTGEVSKKIKTVKTPMKYSNTLKEATQIQRLQNLALLEIELRKNPPRKIELFEQISFEKENLGYAESVFPSVDSHVAIVIGIDKKYTPKVTLYQVKTGTEILVKVDKKKFWYNDNDLLYIGDTIQIKELEERDGWINKDGKWAKDPSKKEWFLNKAKMIRESAKRKTLQE